MARYVIGPDVALELAETRATVHQDHRLLAPTLLRSQVLAALYQRAQAGKLTRKAAEQQLEYLRRLNIRLLGDRALQQEAWKVAEKLSWGETFVAEYVALTKLQGDASVIRDEAIANAARNLVPIAPISALLSA